MFPFEDLPNKDKKKPVPRRTQSAQNVSPYVPPPILYSRAVSDGVLVRSAHEEPDWNEVAKNPELMPVGSPPGHPRTPPSGHRS
jgi:hypothetical protein